MSEKNSNTPNNKKKPIKINLTWLYLAIGAFLIGITFWDNSEDAKQVAYNQFKQYVDSLNNFTKDEIKELKKFNVYNADKL